MAGLICKGHSFNGAKPEVNDLTPNERTMLLEFMLYTMQHDQRHSFMVNHPRLYNVLYPGTLKVQVSTVGSPNCDARVVCDE